MQVKDQQPVLVEEASELSPADIVNLFNAKSESLRLQSCDEPIVYFGLSEAEGHPQGDVRIQYLGHDTKILSKAVRAYIQNGSRLTHDNFVSHTLQDLKRVQAYDVYGSDLIGVLLHVGEGGSFRLAHPEHQDVVFTDPGYYVARFDRQYVENLQSLMKSRSVPRRID